MNGVVLITSRDGDQLRMDDLFGLFSVAQRSFAVRLVPTLI